LVWALHEQLAGLARNGIFETEKTWRMQEPFDRSVSSPDELIANLASFDEFGGRSEQFAILVPDHDPVPVFVNEFWTSKQRAGHSLHEVSYRACFKPALPRFFIERLSSPRALVYDPFMGRGTTLIEAILLGRRVAGCDLNPVAMAMVEPRIRPPNPADIETRLDAVPLNSTGQVWDDLLVFYHPETLRELTALRRYFLDRSMSGLLDDVDRWLRMVAINRLTGHSPGFFSVYTLPPNQAVSIHSQRRINQSRGQKPPYRDVREIIRRKSRNLCKDPISTGFLSLGKSAILIQGSADDTPQLNDCVVDLIVTSPPFLDVVDYAADNWLRGWFCGFDTKAVRVWQMKRLDQWRQAIARCLREFRRVLKKGGWIAFEVGEVRHGKIRLEEHVLELGVAAGLDPVAVLINQQRFTKTANCWGVSNGKKGTNTNRVVIFRNGNF